MSGFRIIGGAAGTAADVNSQKQLVTRAISQPEAGHSSEEGRAYSWASTASDIDAGDTRLYVRNDSDTPLFLDRITINGSNVICNWTINIGAETTTPTGTAVTAVNLNRIYSTTAAEATAYDDETAVADGDTVDSVWSPVTSTLQHNLSGIILGKNHYVQINQETESTSGSVVLFGHYANPS